MPSGRVHAAVLAGVTPIAVGVGWWVGGWRGGGWVAGGCLVAQLVGPDLDLEGWTYNELLWSKSGRWLRRVGGPALAPLAAALAAVGAVWWAVWWGYGRMFKHRGVSHWPLVGTLTRLGYLAVLLDGPVALSGVEVDWVGVGVVAGVVAVADLLHIGMDVISKHRREKVYGRASGSKIDRGGIQ